QLRACEELRRRELDRLVAEPVLTADDRDAFIRQLPRWASYVLGAPRAMVAWEDAEEPRLSVASFDAGSSRYVQLAPGVAEPMLPQPLRDADFLCDRLAAAPQPVIYRSAGAFKRWHGSPLHPALQAQFSATSVLSVRLEGETVRGRIFWLDKPGLSPDDMLLG